MVLDSIPHPDRAALVPPNDAHVITAKELEGRVPPTFSISHIEIFGAKIRDASELCWLLSNSHNTLRHVTLRTEQRITILIDILSPHRAHLQHLTLYFLHWTDAVVDLLHHFPALRELRILHSLNLTSDFPGRLPGWLEHFTFPITQLSSRDGNRGRLTMDIPTRAQDMHIHSCGSGIIESERAVVGAVQGRV
jgi:hypothetical protein